MRREWIEEIHFEKLRNIFGSITFIPPRSGEARANRAFRRDPECMPTRAYECCGFL